MSYKEIYAENEIHPRIDEQNLKEPRLLCSQHFITNEFSFSFKIHFAIIKIMVRTWVGVIKNFNYFKISARYYLTKL